MLALLGASTSAQSSAARAKAAGQRAIASGQRIAKRAPRLSRAVIAAGQRALDAGKQGPKSKSGVATSLDKAIKAPPVTAASPTGGPLLSTAQPRGSVLVADHLPAGVRGPLAAPRGSVFGPAPVSVDNLAAGTRGPVAMPRGSVLAPRPAAPAVPAGNLAAMGPTGALTFSRAGRAAPTGGTKIAPGTRGVRVGDDAEAQQYDMAAALAEAADKLASFANDEVIAVLNQLPEDSALYAKGLTVIEGLQILMADPIDAALNGSQSAQSAADGAMAFLEGVLNDRDTKPPRGIWGWIAEAKAAIAKGGGDTSQPADTTQTTPAAVAQVVIDPPQATLTVGQLQKFSAQAGDANGYLVEPAPKFTWTISPTTGASVDQAGNVTVQTAGTYTVTASANGVSGTATVSASPVSSGVPADGGGGYGGGGGGGGDYGSGDSGEGYGYEDPSQGYDGSGINPGYADDGAYYEPQTYEEAYGEPDPFGDYYPGGYAEEDMEYAADEDPFADAAYDPEDPFAGHEADYGKDLIGKGGGGGGRGGGGRGGRGHGGGHRRGRGGWGGGPYFWGPAYVVNDWDDGGFDLDDVADALAHRLKSRGVEGLALLGASVGEDSWLTIHTRADYENAVTQLKASADNLNLTAANEPGWKALYDNAQRLYEKYHDVGFFASINPFGDSALNDSAWVAIADAQRRVDEFAAMMRAKGKPVAEPAHTPIDNRVFGDKPSEAWEWFKKYSPWIIGGAVVVGVGSAVAPAVVPMLVARGR